ncbi:MAG: hypothetical protein EU542_02815 [Promethearchaeota archaeon]|nr:MAG: hypothetical protein EU542_02815 [Candidatus Lokiarchaeota archaeon]
MKSMKQTHQQLKIELDNKRLKFGNFDEIYFPNNCVICGSSTQNRISKHCYGKYISNYDYTKNYFFSIPICDDCLSNLKLKTGLKAKSGKLLLISTIIGFIVSIVLYLLTLSIFLSIGIVLLSFLIPFRNYKNKTKMKLKFDDFLKIYISKDDVNSVFIDLKNEEYARALREINFEKFKEKEISKKKFEGDLDEVQ